jgi:hypothetical protein
MGHDVNFIVEGVRVFFVDELCRNREEKPGEEKGKAR